MRVLRVLRRHYRTPKFLRGIELTVCTVFHTMSSHLSVDIGLVHYIRRIPRQLRQLFCDQLVLALEFPAEVAVVISMALVTQCG